MKAPRAIGLVATMLAAGMAIAPALADQAGPDSDSASAEPRRIRVEYDQATAVRLDQPVKTIVLGNASIAEAILVNEKLIYVQGRLFGNTNLIALDANGKEILNALVTVGSPREAQVTLYRGNAQYTLACSPRCERTVTIGDADIDIQATSSTNKMTVAKTGSDMSTAR